MINKVILVGRVGGDPEVRPTKTSAVASLTVATSERRLVNDEWTENTEWHNITCFGKLAERMDKVHKGDQVYIEGKIHYSTYDKKDGTKGYKTEIYAEVFKTLEKKQSPAEGKPQYTNKPKKDNWGRDEEAGW